jgi:hypothetical protein
MATVGTPYVLCSDLSGFPSSFSSPLILSLQSDELLVARVDIKKDEEVTYDYVLHYTDPNWVRFFFLFPLL